MKKVWLALLFLGMVASWVGLGAMVVLRTPDAIVDRTAFFILLFAALFCLSVLLFYALGYSAYAWRRWQGDLRRAILQGAPPALAVTAAALLQSMHIFSWAALLIMLALVGLIELLLLPHGAKERRRASDREY
ncbi:MAG: hypothetical protein HY677_01115 [Chloroflexi bacterium]|nr:hypothetical protein [Chloroflexota bacterium]